MVAIVNSAFLRERNEICGYVSLECLSECNYMRSRQKMCIYLATFCDYIACSMIQRTREINFPMGYFIVDLKLANIHGAAVIARLQCRSEVGRQRRRGLYEEISC